MRPMYTVKTYFGSRIKVSIKRKPNCILVDNWNEINVIKNWHCDIDYAYGERNDGFSVGVWKIKQLKN